MELFSGSEGVVYQSVAGPPQGSPGIGEKHWPLTPAQEGMFFQTVAQPRSGCYIEQVVGRLRENLEVGRWLRCWQSALNRYSILRTSFERDDSPEPGQFVNAHASVPIREEDWRSKSPARQESDLSDFLAEDRARGFDLGEAPLMRIALFRLGEADYQFIWTVHHIIVDGRSMNLLLREVFGQYSDETTMTDDVPAAPADFGAYAAWLQEATTDEAKAYWRQRMEGLWEATSLPLPAPCANDVGPHDGGQLRHVLDPEFTTRLSDFAEANGLTLNIVLLGAWMLLAHRYGDTADVVVGATKSVRHGAAAASDGVGPYINTLPIRTRLDESTPALAWLRTLREQWIALRAVEHSPTDVIRACSEIPGDAPLYNLCYVFERESLGDSLRGLGGAWEARDFTLHEHTPVPLILAGYGGPSLRLSVEYDPRRYAASDMTRMMGHLIQLLSEIVEHADTPAARLALLPTDELDALLRGAQPEIVPPALNMTPACFEAVVSRNPEATALRYKEISITYRELNTRANQLARHLRGLGVKAEVRVGVSLAHTPEAMVALLGILKAGGAYVPMDPAYPAERLLYTLQDSGAAVMITDSGTQPRFGGADVKFVLMEGQPSTLDRYSGENLALPIAPDDLAYIIYTSGSTGCPKGVCVNHGEAVVHFELMREVYRLSASDRTLQFASLSFDVSLEQIFAPFFAGSILHIADESMYAAPDFSTVLRDAGITVLNLPPAFWQQWTDEGIAQGLADSGEQFRLLIVGGDVVLPRTVRQWQAFPETAGVLLMNAYGPTETVITALYYEVPPEFGLDTPRDRLPIGRPIRGTETIALDRFQNPVPPGLPGELYIGGNRLARGYHNREELTAQVFVPHPLRAGTGARLYRTGDRVRQLPDGNFEFLGRFDDQVKIRGFRIELKEIENALLRCPRVREAAVRCREDRSGEAQLVAYVVPEQGVALQAAELRAHLRATLPDYMVPAGFALLDAFPVTVNGKVDYKALPALADGAFAPRREYVAPSTRTQRIVAGIWRDILECGDVGIEDSFFDLGGHSLRAARVVTRIRAELGAQVALGDFLLAPTIADLSRLIDGVPGKSGGNGSAVAIDPCVVPLQETGGFPPLFCVLGAGGVRSAYGPLAGHLSNDQKILGLQYSHLPDYRKFTSVESVAARYLTALESVQPDGPYYLAGWSFGGLVAYEMARCLLDQGHEIALLAIIDCEARVPSPPSAGRLIAGLRHRILRLANRVKIMFHTRETLLLHAGDIARIMGRAALGRKQDGASLREYLQFAKSSLHNAYAMKQAGLQPVEGGASRLDVVADDLVKKIVAGLKANEQAATAYRMKPYAGPLTLFRTAEAPAGFGKSDTTLGYGGLVASVEVVVVEGNHFTLVKEPCVRILAGRLSESLAKARRCAEARAGSV
jgi:amino acid adenylation domain-containing protein